MRRYLETFLRHKIALLLPIAIALAASSWIATSKPHKYQSAMTVWFDTAVPNVSSLDNPPNYGNPSQLGQQELQEFIGTRQFLISVGHRGPLATYLNGGHPVASAPSAGATGSNAASALDNQIVNTLSHSFTVSTNGPQIVDITLTGSNPSYIPGTLNAVAAEYQDEIMATRKSRGTAAAAYYQAQLDTAKQSLDTANAAVVAYQRSHPGALSATDPALNQLTLVAYQAQTNYTAVENSYEGATQSYQQAQTASSFHIIDHPVDPYRLSGKKRIIFTVVAGFAAGLVISVLAICALTALDRTARSEADLAGVLGMEVVATIRQLPRRRMLPGLRKAKSS